MNEPHIYEQMIAEIENDLIDRGAETLSPNSLDDPIHDHHFDQLFRQETTPVSSNVRELQDDLDAIDICEDTRSSAERHDFDNVTQRESGRSIDEHNYEEMVAEIVHDFFDRGTETLSPHYLDDPINVHHFDRLFRQETAPVPPIVPAELNNLDEIDMYEDVVVAAFPVGVHDERRREARLEDELLRRDIDDDVERLRNNAAQIETYLQATRPEVEPNHVGRFDRRCPHCRAKFFPLESTMRNTYNKCCSNGSVDLPPLQPHPDLLRQLFKRQHPQSGHFRQNVIVYNNCFQFASIRANLRDVPGRGPYVYAIQGQIYHHYTDINVNRESYRCGPLYFLDPAQATEQRVRDPIYQNVRPELLEQIGHVLADVNPFARQYRFLHDVYDRQMQTEEARNNPDFIPRVYLEFVVTRRDRNRREHDPVQVNEVAAVYEYDEFQGRPANHLRVFLTDRDNRSRTIDPESEVCDPLSFPLLFPRGDLGWRRDIPLRQNRQRTRVSICQYYAYRLAYRYDDDDDENFDVFRFAGRLAQKFIVSAYLRVEANRMSFFRTNQDRLRGDEYEGLVDYVRTMAENLNVPFGRVVVLPSTFAMGPRSQMQRYQDAMAVVNRVGYPSLFITMTCNPRWPEIVENLPVHDEPSNHPLLICRVFQLKLEQLMRDLTINHMMGVCIAHLCVIEFQKRGLPHAHLLITLRNEDKPHDAARIDQLVSAEIPDPETDRELYDLVGTHMIHGPCGAQNADSICMHNGRCTKNFPKYWYNNTTIRRGKVNYRRRRNGRTVEIQRGNQTHVVANDFVVSHNPYLLKKYRTHINVEVVTNVGCVKYLYKYFFKGQDQALMRVVQQDNNVLQPMVHDEITSYLNGRYMTPPEASWHLLSFPFHHNSHHVERLPIHLPGRQRVTFQRGEERVAAENDPPTTRLLQWFETNRTDPDARRLLYPEFPIHYVWVQNRWRRRQRTNKPVVPRIYNVSLRNCELYYLRVLLLHVRGATSFEDLRTVDGEVCETFQDACRNLGLLIEDREWIRCLDEAKERQMPKQIRRMFAYILVFADVEDPPALWQRFREAMMEDFVRLRRLDEESAENAALRKIQYILAVNGRRLSEFGLTDPPDFDPATEEQEDVVPESRERADEMIARLNDDQRNVFDAVTRAVDNDDERRRLFFLNGAAGTGKTFLYNTLIAHLTARNVKVLPVAWTGLAAALLKGGRTVHSRFRLPIQIDENTRSSITHQSREAAFIREAQLIVWDEVSMTSRLAFDIVEGGLRFLCDNDRPFGGKCVVLGGDFKQCLPIVLGGDRTTIVDSCVKASRHWRLFEPLTLRINMRVAPEEQEFVAWLDNLGNGTLEAPEIERAARHGIVPIPNECSVGSVDELIVKVYGDLKAGDVPNKAILTPLNDNCQKINAKIVESIRDAAQRVYVSADSIVTDEPSEADNFTLEFINNLDPSGFPPNKLHLKEGIIVMLLKNLNVRANLCNGTRLLIRKLGDHYIDAERIDFDGRLSGKTVFIPRVDFKSTGDRTLPFTLYRRQFPVKPAYAMTINKAQGQTFDTVGIHLPSPVFEHGQLYVAFSRGRRFDQVFVCALETTQQGRLLQGSNTRYTRNIVYDEILYFGHMFLYLPSTSQQGTSQRDNNTKYIRNIPY